MKARCPGKHCRAQEVVVDVHVVTKPHPTDANPYATQHRRGALGVGAMVFALFVLAFGLAVESWMGCTLALALAVWGAVRAERAERAAQALDRRRR